ncbi:MAG TPA: hypothetical protein DIS76_00840 [Rhodospirillaceae bacterium]|nr:hypothetical protein [Rhodospirillaceae bacterium]
MANLIITIISIALVAVAALMGAYYGGAAFMEGSAKAGASRMINEARQIEGALHLWRLDNGNSIDLPDSNLNFLVSQGYMTRLSTYAPPLVDWSSTLLCGKKDVYDTGFQDGAADCTGAAVATSPSRYLYLLIEGDPGGANPPEVCKQIVRIAYGSSATPTNSGIPDANRKIDCMRMYSGAATQWTFTYQLF